MDNSEKHKIKTASDLSITSSLPPFTTEPNNFYVLEAEARLNINGNIVSYADRVNITIIESELLV